MRGLEANETGHSADAAERLQALVRAVEHLSAARSLDEVVSTLRSTARGVAGSDGIAVVLRDGTECHYVAEDAKATLWEGQRFPADSCISGLAMRTGATVVIPDILADTRVPHETYRPTFVRAMAAIPIGRPEPTAALGVYWAEAGTVDEAAVERLETLARAASTAIENGRLFEALFESERRFRALFEGNSVGMAIYDAETRRVPEVNARMLELAGLTRAEFTNGHRDFVAATAPEFLARDEQARGEILATGRIQPYEKEFLHPDGRRVPILMTASPLFGGRGQTVVTAQDLSEVRRAQAALRESEALLRQVAETIREVFYVYDVEGPRVAYVSSAYEELWGRTRESLTAEPLSFMDAIHPEDQHLVKGAMARQLEGRTTEIEYRLLRADGDVRWVWDRAYPLRDDWGAVWRVVGVAEEITARRNAEERQRLLAGELDHRTRNLIAVVRSLIGQTLKGQPLPPALAASLDGRLAALAEAHGLLTRLGWEAVPVQEVAAVALKPFRAHADRIVVEGPDAMLPAQAGVMVALALHELATNALKYGCLSCDGGSVDLRWRVEQGQARERLQLVWRERGGPEVEQPLRRGFGSRLIERGLQQFGGGSELRFERAGVVAEVSVQI